MSSVMEVQSYSPELLDHIISNIEGEVAKDVARQIIRIFDQSNLTIKVKYLFPTKPWAYYRILCFIKKSKETVIINTKKDCGRDGVVEGMIIQLRIENQATFGKLDELSENIRSRIVNGGECRYCCTKCEGKRYTFTYQGKEYVKCQFICSNFRFEDINERDIASLMDIIHSEIHYKQNRR